MKKPCIIKVSVPERHQGQNRQSIGRQPVKDLPDKNTKNWGKELKNEYNEER